MTTGSTGAAVGGGNGKGGATFLPTYQNPDPEWIEKARDQPFQTRLGNIRSIVLNDSTSPFYQHWRALNHLQTHRGGNDTDLMQSSLLEFFVTDKPKKGPFITWLGKKADQGFTRISSTNLAKKASALTTKVSTFFDRDKDKDAAKENKIAKEKEKIAVNNIRSSLLYSRKIFPETTPGSDIAFQGEQVLDAANCHLAGITKMLILMSDYNFIKQDSKGNYVLELAAFDQFSKDFPAAIQSKLIEPTKGNIANFYLGQAYKTAWKGYNLVVNGGDALRSKYKNLTRFYDFGVVAKGAIKILVPAAAITALSFTVSPLLALGAAVTSVGFLGAAIVDRRTNFPLDTAFKRQKPGIWADVVNDLRHRKAPLIAWDKMINIPSPVSPNQNSTAKDGRPGIVETYFVKLPIVGLNFLGGPILGTTAFLTSGITTFGRIAKPQSTVIKIVSWLGVIGFGMSGVKAGYDKVFHSSADSATSASVSHQQVMDDIGPSSNRGASPTASPSIYDDISPAKPATPPPLAQPKASPSEQKLRPRYNFTLIRGTPWSERIANVRTNDYNSKLDREDKGASTKALISKDLEQTNNERTV